MRQKLKPEQNLEEVQAELIETICSKYQKGVSVRTLAKDLELSPMKVRKILITGDVYSTDLSTEINELWKDGKTVGEIAELLNMTTANVNSYLPYERVVYKMVERSVEADRQQRYRDRKKGLLPFVDKDEQLPVIPRARNKTLIIVVGKKLRKKLPDSLLDPYSDPISREITFWGDDMWEPKDPNPSIWCAELVTSGRGKDKKYGILLENANCGFVVCAPLPPVPDQEGEVLSVKELRAYKSQLEQILISTIRASMIDFCLPEARVSDYTDTIDRIELVKGKQTTPMTRVEELIQSLDWPEDAEPGTAFRGRRINFDSRKFGNSPWYRSVYESVCKMLMLTDEEQKAWLDAFFEPVRERL